MNRIYRVLWSVVTQTWQVAPETAKSTGKKSKSSASGLIAYAVLSSILTGGVVAQSVPALNQLPTGGVVVRGTATLTQTATAQAATMTVNQTSQSAVVNWTTFNLGSAASINFVQPNAQAVILNRVNDSNPSQIFGRITSNGQVFLTNANGVYFSPTASVDVGALTATTHAISDDNFVSGNYVFKRNGATGKVINEGRINSALGGYVALLAPEVQNSGVVVARAGTVAMAAGEMITLKVDGAGSLAGITTTPSTIATLIENKQVVQAPDGQIILSAVAMNKLQAGVIKNSGNLEANSLVSKGGKIYLEGDEIALASTSKIQTKGVTDGGTVLIGGNWQGNGDLRQATKVDMAAGANIDASSTDKGNGGVVVLWSDVSNSNSVTHINGSIKAEAGANGGNGGKIETSGHTLNVEGIQISTQATAGQTGEWLLDPYNVTIASSTSNNTLAANTYTPSGANSSISASTLSTNLNTSSITVTTSGAGTESGDITVNAAITKTGTTSRSTLTLVAARDININQKIESTGTGTYSPLNVVLTAGNNISLSNNSFINTNGGNFYIGTVTGADSVGLSGQNLSLAQGSYINSGKGLLTIKVGGSIALPDNSAQTSKFAISSQYDTTYGYPISNSATSAIAYNYTSKLATIYASGNITTANASSSYADIYMGNDFSLTARNIGTAANPLQITGSSDQYGLVTSATTSTATYANTSRILTVNNSYGSTYINQIANSGYNNQAFNTINLNLSNQISSTHNINISGNPGGELDPYAGTGHIMLTTDATGTLVVPNKGINTVGVGITSTVASTYVPATLKYTGGQEPSVFPTSVSLAAPKISLTDQSINIGSNYYSYYQYSGSTSKYSVAMAYGGLGTNFSATASTSITNTSSNYISSISAYSLSLSSPLIGSLGNSVNISKGSTLTLTTQDGVDSGLFIKAVDNGFTNITISNNRLDSRASSTASLLWYNGDHINYTYGGGNSYYVASNGGTYSLLSGVATFTNPTGINLSNSARTLAINSNSIAPGSASSPNGLGAGYVTLEPNAIVMGNSGSVTITQNAPNSDSNGNGIASTVSDGSVNITGVNITVNNANSTNSYALVNSAAVYTPIKTGITNLVFNPINYYTSGVTKYALASSLTVSSYWGNIDVSVNKTPDLSLTPNRDRFFNNLTSTSNALASGQTIRVAFINSTDVINLADINGTYTLNNSNLALSDSNTNFTFTPSGKSVQIDSVALGTGNYSINTGTGSIRLNSDVLTNGGNISLVAANLVLMKSITINSNADEISNINHTGASGSISISASKISANGEGYTLSVDSGSQNAASNNITLGSGNSFDNSTVSVNGVAYGGKYLGGVSLKATRAAPTGTTDGYVYDYANGNTYIKGSFSAEGYVTANYGLTINTNPDGTLVNAGDIKFAGPSLAFSPSYNFTFNAKSTLGNGGNIDLYNNTAHSTLSAYSLAIDSSTSFASGSSGTVSLPTLILNTVNGTNTVSVTGGQINVYGNINTQSYGTTATATNGKISLTGDIRLGADVTMSTWQSNVTSYNNLYAGSITLGGVGVSSLTGNKSLTLNTSTNSSYSAYFSTSPSNVSFNHNAGSISLKGNSLGLGLNTVTVNANATVNTYATGVYGDITINGVNSVGAQTYSGKNLTFTSGSTISQGALSVTSYGDVLINSDVTATSTITLTSNASSSNTVSGTGTLNTGSGLKLLGNNTSYTLSNANNVSNLAATLSGSGSLTFKNATALAIGTVASVNGINTPGVIDIRTTTGNLTLNKSVTTTSTSLSAVTLAAGVGSSAGASTGGDVVINSPASVSTGTGARTLIYTGSVSGSNFNQLVSQGNFRYNSDTTSSNFTQSITSSQTYAIYREQPLISITASALSKTYDGFSFTGGNGYTYSGLVNGDSASTIGTVTYAAGTSQNAVNAGSYAITPFIASANALGYGYSYTSGALTITPAHLTVTANNATKTYGDANPAFSTTVTGFVNNETWATAGVTGAASATTLATASTGAGSAVITPGAGTLSASNYDFTRLVNGTLTIQKAPLTVTANSVSKTYGDANPTLSTTLSGFVNNENLATSGVTGLGAATTTASTQTDVGTAVITAGVGSLNAANYSFNQFVNGTLTIGQRTLIASSINSASSTYGNMLAAGTVNFSNKVGTDDVQAVTSVTVPSGSLSSAGFTKAGDYFQSASSVLTGTKAGNYTFAGFDSSTANYTVNPKQLTIVVPGATKVYDSSNTIYPTAAASITGVLTGDDVQLGSGNVTGFVDKNVGVNKAVTYTGFTISGGSDASNYLLSTNPASTASITPKALTVTGTTVANKVYDGTTAATLSNGVLSGVVSSDASNVLLTQVGSFADKNVGVGKVVTAANTLGGAEASNYSLTQPTGLSADITPKALTVTGTTVANKVYDGTIAATLSNGVLSGVVSSDASNVLLTQAGSFADKNVGVGKVVTAANTLGGAEASNYSLTQPTGLSADITPKALTVTGTTVANKVYDGTIAATLSNGVLSGVVSSDASNVLLTQAGSFADKNVGVGKVVTAANTIEGTGASNYSLNQPIGLSADITKAPLTVTANNASKTYGDANPTLSTTVSGFVNGETLATSGVSGNAALSTVATTNTNAGSVAISLGIGSLVASNYDFSNLLPGTLTINPRPVVLSGTMNYSGQAIIDTTATSSALNVSNTVFNDSVSVGGSAVLGNASPGTQPITNFSGLNLTNNNYTTIGASGNVNVIKTSDINITVLKNTEISTLIGNQLAGLSRLQMGSFSNGQLQLFSAQQISSLSAQQLSGFSANQFASLRNNQLEGLSPSQVSAISSVQLTSMTPSQITLLTSNPSAPLSYGQLTLLKPMQVSAISPQQISQLHAAEIASFNDEQIGALTPIQLAAIAPSNFGAFTPEQIMLLSSSQIQSLSPAQLSAFTPIQIASLKSSDIANFTSLQLAAIGIFPKADPTNAYEAAIPVMTAVATPSVQLPNVPIANMTGLEIRSLSPEQLNSLTREQITNLNPAQLQALTTTQISQLNPEKVENLLPSQLSVMSARQLEALPSPVSPSNSSSSTGLLSVTILHSPETKVAAPVGIAFEQNANSISLTSTSAPVQPISSDGVTFSGKLTTFMVATKNGELVAFEGGLVNNRMVIVASTNVAKQIAQSEINLVLAAAVTSLNKEGNLMLAQLEGVVLDLR